MRHSIRVRQTVPVTRTLEFWPDYGQGPLWDERGRAVDLDALALRPALVERIRNWHGRYEEDRIPVDGSGDPTWLSEGLELLTAIRNSLPDIRVVVTEPWWGEAQSGAPKSRE
ncbi:hypothetical protein GCM10009741_75460 [Kribbella lupini]|uniref:Uncharacterized protein n=1 Tax=Kribbella lupini TaxID=291602 RepID=A0ABP4NEG7_9ACTN